ncbi:hypothetical protein SLEP1_g40528 [Rubroshorea leprosula]|uniref:Uncharacterized protein n=1 Tax=Rubroshorea leprosula TaxID=152421 RepID=A0AAV5L3N7_9ROSI|nr:hypothetical protein SLEP1_g40528 [Rubroshorea leprosula]
MTKSLDIKIAGNEIKPRSKLNQPSYKPIAVIDFAKPRRFIQPVTISEGTGQ